MGKNVMVFGPAGTGKSLCVKQAFESSDRVAKYPICPTGMVASSWEDGLTIHAWAGFIGRIEIPSNEKESAILAKRACRHLQKMGSKDKYQSQKSVFILKEISMWSLAQLHFFDRVMKLLMGNSKSFGGMQVVCLGDHAQLPPVIKNAPDPYEHSCIFSELMNKFVVFELKGSSQTTVYGWNRRRKDIDARRCTVGILQCIRNYHLEDHWSTDAYGMITYRSRNKRLETEDNIVDALGVPDGTPILAYHNITVNELNKAFLSRIDGPQIQIIPYFKNATPEQLKSWTLTVKAGCVVFLLERYAQQNQGFVR